MLLVLQVIMAAKSGIQIGSLITAFMSYNGRIIFYGFDAFYRGWKTYVPMTISIFSNGTGIMLSILPMLCAFAFLIVTFFKKKFIIGVYASVVIAFIILTSAFSFSILAVLVERILTQGPAIISLLSDIPHMSIDIEVVVRTLIRVIIFLSTPLLQISLHWIPFVIFLLLCLSLITIASKDPYAAKGGRRK